MSAHTSPYDELARVFHEPKRLAIVSALCAQPDGLSFSELKKEGDFTDGNLSRHLKTLEDDGVVYLHKAFVGVKPRTTVFLSDSGRERFLAYLKALESVLSRAAEAVELHDDATESGPRTARA